jgi:O-antigen/teichoic acid export membrane protein
MHPINERQMHPGLITASAAIANPSVNAPPGETERHHGEQPIQPSLRTNFYWTFAGNAVNAACQLGLMALLAKLGNVEMVGTYSLAQAIAYPIVTFMILHLRGPFVTDVANQHSFADYFGLRFVGVCLAVPAVAISGLLFHMEGQVLAILILVAASRAIDGIGEMFRSLFQKYEWMHLSSIDLMLRGISAISIVAISLKVTGSLMYAMAALCGAWLLMIALYDVPRARALWKTVVGSDSRELRPRLRATDVRQILPYASLLGAVTAIVMVQGSLPRLFLESHQGKAAVGYFSAALYPLGIGIVIIGSLGESALPRLTRLLNEGTGPFLRLLGKLLILAVALGLAVLLGCILFGRLFLRLMYTPEYAEYHRELVIMAASAVFQFSSSFLGYSLSATREFYVQAVIAAVSCVSAAVACAVLVPRHGVTGAAIAFTLSCAASLVTAAICLAWALARRRRRAGALPATAAAPDAPDAPLP